MAKGEAGRAAESNLRLARASILGLLALGCVTAAGGCDDRLPGFADPPAYDAGDAGDGDAEVDDEDAG